MGVRGSVTYGFCSMLQTEMSSGDKAAKVDIELGMKDMLWCELGMESCTCGSDANVEISGKSGVGRYGNRGMHYTTLSIHFDILGSLC
jgi:hypothetical protein